ncbi:MAG: hypothetical protein J1F31_02780 [Erysipelotrichales bacterium]|nr:hypothetical protein [Erysipelotrichales bacterium]
MKLLLPLLAVGLIAGHGPARLNNKISDADFCFYENTKIEEKYGDGYKFDQVLNVSGVDWVFSNFAYGLDNPSHQPSVTRKGLYTNTIWDVSANLNVDALDNEGSPFYSSIYKDEYRSLLNGRPNNLFTYNSVIMSKDYLPAKSIEDITLFTSYSTGSVGIVMMVQPEGEDWKPLYHVADSHFMSHYTGTIDDLIDDGVSNSFAPEETISIDGTSYTRYFDGYCLYEDVKYGNIPNKPFKFAFVLQASANYQFDFVLDGIVVNKKESIKNYLDGILNKDICDNGFDSNLSESFALMNKIMSESDIEYLQSEFHDDGKTSYYNTYKYLNDRIFESENDAILDNGLYLILSSGLESCSGIIVISGLILLSVGAYFLVIRRKTKRQN